MKRGLYRMFRIRGLGLAARGVVGAGDSAGQGTQSMLPEVALSSPQPHPAPGPEPRAPIHDDFAAMHEVVLRRYRAA